MLTFRFVVAGPLSLDMPSHYSTTFGDKNFPLIGDFIENNMLFFPNFFLIIPLLYFPINIFDIAYI